ncbi:MAG: VCBS repeat-containing protein, partial [Actinobacteria bacterium]|nr:VCBS repeat-containing protein [Actinomycetota bacterium]
QGAFRFGTSADPVAMIGSGLCWLDYDRDGWLNGAGLALRGMGCVAAALDLDGDSDLYVTAAGVSALWNDGNGRFREGAAAAGVAASGWRSSAAVGDVNGDRRGIQPWRLSSNFAWAF